MKNVLEHMKSFDIITFDIFDTLLTRCVYEPDDLFRLLEVELQHDNKDMPFFIWRKKAENDARKLYGHDVNIHEIYRSFAEVAGISQEAADEIKMQEINLEIKFCIPRCDVQNIYFELLSAKKDIILISDMYLTGEILQRMLEHCGYYGWKRLIVSCEENARKSDGKLWEKVYREYPASQMIHVGDNLSSDIREVHSRGHSALYFMDGRSLFSKTHMYRVGLLSKTFLKVGDSLVRGLIINKKLCNSPFVFQQGRPEICLRDLHTCGYSIYGPAIFYFFLWFNEHIEHNMPETIWFFSREGYYLKYLYQVFCQLTGKELVPREKCVYFYTSRRAASVVNIVTEEDIRGLLNTGYIGMKSRFLQSHFGIEMDAADLDSHIELPKEKDAVFLAIKSYIPRILRQASSERKAYLQYIAALEPDYLNRKIAIVDIGYSGTAQYYLSKLMGHATDGYYFSTSKYLKPVGVGCNVFSCFGEQKPGDPSNDHWAMFEAFLAAPHGQFCYFENKEQKLSPVFADTLTSEQKNIQFNEVCYGVVDFMKDMLQLMPYCSR